MGKPHPAASVKLLAGLLSGDPDLLQRARQLLAKRFGSVDLDSDTWPFDQTNYYADEMGANLLRRFVAFQEPVRPDRLAEIKLETNALEQRIAEDCLRPESARPVNIDPGYLDLSRLVLATTKDRSHRIYLGHGIYAEVSLQYVRGEWQPLPWTYPDYRRPEYHAFFTQVRERYRAQAHVSTPHAGADGGSRG